MPPERTSPSATYFVKPYLDEAETRYALTQLVLLGKVTEQDLFCPKLGLDLVCGLDNQLRVHLVCCVEEGLITGRITLAFGAQV